MALTKTGIRDQLRKNLVQDAPPGERLIAYVQGQTGPSPLLTTLVMNLPPLVALLEGLRSYYLLALTDTTLVVYQANRASNRPTQRVASLPLATNPITGVTKGKIWSRVYLQLPGRSKPTRFYVSPTWNKQLDAFDQPS